MAVTDDHESELIEGRRATPAVTNSENEPARRRISRRRVLALGALGVVAAGGAAFGIDEWVTAGPTTPRYQTQPELLRPTVTVEAPADGVAPGFIFLTPVNTEDPSQPRGPMIVDNAGQLLWFRPLQGELQATNLRVQLYRGEPVLHLVGG